MDNSSAIARETLPSPLWSSLSRRLRHRLSFGLISRSIHIGHKRQLRDVPIPPADIPISVRPLRDADLETLLPPDTSGLDEAERNEIETRRSFARRVPVGGWVAVDLRNGQPCFMMWIIDHANSNGVAQLEGTPRLRPHQIATENVYVAPGYRGKRISTPASLAAIEMARGDATEVIAFIGETNLVSRQGAARSGLTPYIRHVRWHLLFGLVHIDLFDRKLPSPLTATAPIAAKA